MKLSRVIAALEHHFNHVLVHSGQNYDYELNQVFFDELGIRPPDHLLGAVGATVAETIGQVISRFDQILELETPDAVLIYGDTNTCLGVIAAKRRKIPIFHMEAGNRSFDQRIPEELNRKVVDHLSDVNMTNSEHARRYLLAEGMRPDLIVKTGSPMKEVLAYYAPQVENARAVESHGLRRGQYLLVSAHREETVDVPSKLFDLLESLTAIQAHFDQPVLVSTHPRTWRRLTEAGLKVDSTCDAAIRFLRPFGFFDYISLQKNAFCVLSDSGTLTEEASLLGFPAVMLREAHERPEGMDGGVVPFSGVKRERVLQAIQLATDQPEQMSCRPLLDYTVDDVSRIVSNTILSYVDYVNRVVWLRQPLP